MIPIVYRTGEEGLVPPKFLDILLYLRQVQLFKRTEGWVVVGVDQLRNSSSPYSGINLRKHQQTPLPEPIETDIWPCNSVLYQ